MAADTILKAAGDYRREQLQPYARRLESRFGDPGASNGSEPSSLRCVVGGKLLQSRWFTRHVVLDRWFLHNTQEVLQIAGN